MSTPDQLLRLADSATVLANAGAVTALCDLLRHKGMLDPQEIEALKHFHLLPFDDLLQEGDLRPDERQAIEDRRAQIERSWPKPTDDDPTPHL